MTPSDDSVAEFQEVHLATNNRDPAVFKQDAFRRCSLSLPKGFRCEIVKVRATLSQMVKLKHLKLHSLKDVKEKLGCDDQSATTNAGDRFGRPTLGRELHGLHCQTPDFVVFCPTFSSLQVSSSPVCKSLR